jgi:sterol 3beta-glucosyltransferase
MPTDRMKVFVATIGTRGDVQPYVALAEGLSGAGHAVTVCTSPRYESMITGRGIGYGYLSDDLVALVETPRGREAIAAAGGAISGLRSLFALIRQSLQIQRDLFRDGWAAAREAEPDLVVYHPKMAIALHYAERLGIPAVMAPLFPMFRPTGAYPNPGFPGLPFGGRLGTAYNRATHRLVLGAVGAASRRLFASWRRSEGLPPRPAAGDVMHRDDGSPVPLVNGWSRHLAPDRGLSVLRRPAVLGAARAGVRGRTRSRRAEEADGRAAGLRAVRSDREPGDTSARCATGREDPE